GEGGMGAVWMADDLQTGQTVAVKQIRPELLTSSPEYIKRFEREAEMLRELDHPNIIRVLAFFEEAGQRCLVMPFLPGGSLSARLARERLTVRQVREFGLDLCDALTRAHSLGIIHRDLKPDNVLINDRGDLVLTDFGVARLRSAGTALTQEGALVGSIGYVSPEICEGREATERSDIWSLGVVFYEMLAGRAPFERGTLSATLTAILMEPAPDLRRLRPDVPLEMVDLLGRMLEKDPAYRIDSVRQVAAALERVPDDAAASPGLTTDFDWPAAPRREVETETGTGAPDSDYVPPSTPPPITPRPATPPPAAPAAQSSPWFRAAVLVLVTTFIVTLALIVVIIVARPGAPPPPAPIPTLEPLAPHQRLLLVADFERLGGDETAVGRIISDQLDRAYRVLPSSQPVAVRRYPAVIAGEEDARTVGRELGADVVVWGTYFGERIDARLTPIDIPPGITLLEGTALAHIPEISTGEIDKLVFVSGPVLNQTLMAKNHADMASMVYVLMAEWPRPAGIEDFIPGDTAPAYLLRYYARYTSDKEAALDAINTAIRQESTLPALFQLKSVVLSNLERYDEALASAETSAQLAPDLSGAVMMTCVIRLARAEYAAAVAACERTYEVEPGWYSAMLLGMAYFYQNRIDAALEAAQNAVADAPVSGYPYSVLALAQARLGRLDASFATFRELIDLFPDSKAGTRITESFVGAWDATLAYDAVYPLMQGRYDEALAILEPDEAAPDASLTAFLAGLVYCMTGDDAAAEASYTRALAQNDGFELAYLLRAEVRRNQGNLAGALADFAKAQALSTGADFDALIERGTAGELSCKDYAPGAAGE
ncbi:MAG: protein kinase, partial [Anaerolineae bacterium]|nr:protein kinase [Anaerolineae bacterium]